MAMLDGSIVIIALPAIFRGIHLDPLAPGNIAFLLWMIMGYRLVQAVFVVTLGRLGDMFGRVQIYNAGFAVFTVSSILLSVGPFLGRQGALWLIGWRLIQAMGGSMLMANSVAILTDAFPSISVASRSASTRWLALAGMFVGLVAGGLLAAVNWRSVFWVNVPVGVFGTLWAYWRLREVSDRQGRAHRLVGQPHLRGGSRLDPRRRHIGIQPYHHAHGLDEPGGLALLFGGAAPAGRLRRHRDQGGRSAVPADLFRIRAFTAGNVASFAARLGQGGLQFMLVIWLQGIWLPLHGYSYS